VVEVLNIFLNYTSAADNWLVLHHFWEEVSFDREGWFCLTCVMNQRDWKPTCAWYDLFRSLLLKSYVVLKVYSYALVERVYFVILLYVTRLQKYFDLLYIKFLNDSLKSNKCFCLTWVVSLTLVRYTNSSLVGVNLLLLMKKMHTCSPWRIHIYVLEGIFVGGVFGVLQYQTGYCWISFPTEVSVSSLFSSQIYSCEIYIITCELNYKRSVEQLSSMFSSCSLCYIYHLPSQMHSQPDWMMGKW